MSGQVVRIGATALNADGIDWELPLAGKFALVTGASRGIGKAIAKVLARDGAHVIGLDVPGLERELEETIGELSGSTLVLDITDDDAPRANRHAPSSRITAASTWSSTTRASRATRRSGGWTRTAGTWCSGST